MHLVIPCCISLYYRTSICCLPLRKLQYYNWLSEHKTIHKRSFCNKPLFVCQDTAFCYARCCFLPTETLLIANKDDAYRKDLASAVESSRQMNANSHKLQYFQNGTSFSFTFLWTIVFLLDTRLSKQKCHGSFSCCRALAAAGDNALSATITLT